ncbi:MAG: hypothetical protein R2824_12650 [Saprospiraceae bacterium]|nr:hypothetical protein [Lewinella sp.]
MLQKRFSNDNRKIVFSIEPQIYRIPPALSVHLYLPYRASFMPASTYEIASPNEWSCMPSYRKYGPCPTGTYIPFFQRPFRSYSCISTHRLNNSLFK